MILNLLSALFMSGITLMILFKARLRETKRLIFIPFTCCILELVTIGYLSATLFPAVTVLLTLCRVAIIATCLLALRRDRLVCRRNAARKRKASPALHVASATVQNLCA